MTAVSFIHSSVTMVMASNKFGKKSTKNFLKLSFFFFFFFFFLRSVKIAFICPKYTLFVKLQTLINKMKF